jgi:hypothetical protein
VELSWAVVRDDTDEEVCGASSLVDVPADDVLAADRVAWSIPRSTPPGAYRIAMRVDGPDGTTLSENHTEITLR